MDNLNILDRLLHSILTYQNIVVYIWKIYSFFYPLKWINK